MNTDEKAAQATKSTMAAPSPAQLESQWLKTRESNIVTSEPTTPMVPIANPLLDDPVSRMSRTSSNLTSPTPPAVTASSAMNVDAEDEDVKIAVIALGAMKHLDGESRSRSLSQSGKGTGKASTSSAISTSSVGSTAISSPSLSSSTLGTELTHSTFPSSISTEATTSTSFSNAATLADLPLDFPFPAIVHDEEGNEMRVDREDMTDDDFLKRVSHLPIVRGTLKAYEMGKQRSRVVRYGGDFVESSVKAISRPVVSRLGARLGERGVEQLDDFACRQLDRIYPASDRAESKEERQLILQELDEKDRTEWKDMTEEEKLKRRRAYWALRLEEKEREVMINEMQRKEEARSKGASSSGTSTSPSVQGKIGGRGGQDLQAGSAPVQALVRQHNRMQNEKAVGNSASNVGMGGTGWGSMLVEAGVTAGGLSAAMSTESMKSLKYCLQWLQYATAHIEHQITILRDLIVKLNHGELDLSSPASQNLAIIKGDVVNTIRGVVDVVSKYAGGALPEPARASVKAFILSLPARWARVNRAPDTMDSSGRQGSFGGSPASPSFFSAHGSGYAESSSSTSSLSSTAAARQQAAATAVAANRVLTLAVESLDILRSVTVVFGESLDRADLWVERLRVLGLQRKRAHEQAAAEEAAAEIDMGMGGVVGRGNWESNRGFRAPRVSHSPGAESNMSVDTSASAKRRRTKRRATNKARSSPSPRPATSDDELVSDEGSQTETERASLGRTTQSSAVSLHNSHHQYHSGTSQRRTKGKGNGRSSNKTSSANNTPTPMLQNLSLHDSPDTPPPRTYRQ